MAPPVGVKDYGLGEPGERIGGSCGESDDALPPTPSS